MSPFAPILIIAAWPARAHRGIGYRLSVAVDHPSGNKHLGNRRDGKVELNVIARTDLNPVGRAAAEIGIGTDQAHIVLDHCRGKSLPLILICAGRRPGRADRVGITQPKGVGGVNSEVLRIRVVEGDCKVVVAPVAGARHARSVLIQINLAATEGGNQLARALINYIAENMRFVRLGRQTKRQVRLFFVGTDRDRHGMRVRLVTVVIDRQDIGAGRQDKAALTEVIKTVKLGKTEVGAVIIRKTHRGGAVGSCRGGRVEFDADPAERVHGSILGANKTLQISGQRIGRPRQIGHGAALLGHPVEILPGHADHRPFQFRTAVNQGHLQRTVEPAEDGIT